MICNDLKVVVLEERPTGSLDAAGKADGSSVAIFNPEVMENASAKPEKTKNVEEVMRRKAFHGKNSLPGIKGKAKRTHRP